MADKKQPKEQKDMGARPKERKNRGRSALTPAQSDEAVVSTVREDSEKLGEYTLSVVDNRCDDRKPPKKKSQQSKNNPADNKDETSHLTIQKNRKQSIKDTPANREKHNGTLSGTNDKTVSVPYPLNGLPTATKEKPLNKLKTSRSLDLGANRTKDQSSIMETTDKQQQLSHAKYKSSDDIREDGQCKAKVDLEKKVSGKMNKEKKTNVSNLDNGEVAEAKERGGKTVHSKPRRLKDVVEKLRLKAIDISKAAQKVNTVVGRILKSEQFSNDTLFKDIKKMSTGSYYEHVKISNPNEFDIMLEITLSTHNTIIPTNFDKTGPYYTLAFKERKPAAMNIYLDEENTISARKIMEKFRDLIKQIIGKPGMKEVSLQKREPGSPAVTLIIKNEPQNISVDLVLSLKIITKWPEQTADGMNIDDWLGLKVKQEFKKCNYFMVPKQVMKGKKPLDADTWRISFSNIEKKIMTNHGHGKTCCESGGSKKDMCCRKQCLKLLKYLLELLKTNGNKKRMDQFCSYHAKTALLHHCADHPKDEEWKLEDLEECFNRYVEYFQACLKKRELPNFFIPSHNLFSREFVDKSNCDILYNKIEEQKINGYPIFYN